MFHPIKEELPTFNNTDYCLNHGNSSLYGPASDFQTVIDNNTTHFDKEEQFTRFQERYSAEINIWLNRTAQDELKGNKPVCVTCSICLFLKYV